MVANLSSFAAIRYPLQYLEFKTNAAQGNVPYLSNVHGMAMSILDGYVLTLSVVPRTPRPVSLLTKGSAQRITTLDNFKSSMEETLANSSAGFRGSPTMKRNNTTSLRRMNIVSNDQQPLLDLMDLALARTSTPRDVQWHLAISKFGQREDAVDLVTLLDPELVCSVAVHLAINIKIAGSTLFWSRREWQQLIGPHGRIFPVLSTREMVNVQSRLDGTPPMVPAQLMRVINLPGQVIFYQAYTDLPHNHMTDVWRHPVTGNVVSCGCLRPAVLCKLARSARAYIAHISDIASKINAGPAPLRLEVVAEDWLEDLAPFLCDPATFVDANGLRPLLEEHSFLVPFQETPEMPFLSRIREYLEYIKGELACVCQENGTKGGLIATWREFQLEIAVETFLWGHPLSPTSATFCSRLGLSPTDDESATHQRGLLTLKTLPIPDAHEDQTPPLSRWVTSFLQRRRIASIFDFEDFLGAFSSVIGEKIIHVALKDLYQNSRPPVHSLKAGEDHPPLVRW